MPNVPPPTNRSASTTMNVLLRFFDGWDVDCADSIMSFIVLLVIIYFQKDCLKDRLSAEVCYRPLLRLPWHRHNSISPAGRQDLHPEDQWLLAGCCHICFW